MHKKRAFSLIELMIILVAVSLILMAFVPILFKRGEKTSDVECVGGFKSVRLEYDKSGTYSFSVPIEITSPITVTLIGAGQGGANGASEERTSNSCSFSKSSSDNNFYTNFTLNFVGTGGNCDASIPKAGDSGNYLINYIIETSKGNENIFSCTTDSCYVTDNNGNNHTITLINGIKGDKNSSSSPPPEILSGGTSPLGTFGVGQNCIWSNANGGKYIPDGNAGSSACQFSYKIATPGTGGMGGAYAKIKTAMVMSGVTCSASIGAGSTSAETPGANTSISCDNNIKYTALGGGQTSGISDNTGFSLISSSLNQNASSLDSTKISGGKGGDVKTDDTTIYSNGGVGGCDGAETSFQCQNPNGAIGTKGSGGGGGSCNEQTCGIGGKGGDGLVIVEYQMKCK